MGISKLGKTGPSASLIDYLIRELDAKIIGGTFYGTKRQLLAQSGAWNRLRPDLRNNTLHLIESYAPKEEVSDEIVNVRALEKLKRLGLNDRPFLVVKHTDKEHYLHIHILVSRIKIDGSVVDDSSMALKAIAVTKELDREFGMHETPFYFRAERIRRKEYEMMKRTGEDSQNEILRKIINQAAEKSEKSFEKFLKNLEREKVGFWLYLNDDQTNIKGIAFDCQKTGHTKGISGSGLGDGFKFQALAKRIGYDKKKDYPKLIETYQLKLKSEVKPRLKKPKRRAGKDVYILVSRSAGASTENDGEVKNVSNENSAKNVNILTDYKPIETLKLEVENQLEKSKFPPQFRAPEIGIDAEHFSPASSSPNSITENKNHPPTIKRNDDEKITESVNSKDVLIKGREVQLFYKNDGADADTETGQDSVQAPPQRLIKSLQNKIDQASESEESFAGFLQNLQSRKIICLPEIDDDERVLDFVFIKKGIAVSSGELEEDYKFSALAKKLDYPDKPLFVTLPNEDRNSFKIQIAALRDKPVSEYWWKIKTETNEKGQIKISPAAFEFLRVAYKKNFQEGVESFEDYFAESGTTDKFLQKIDEIEKHAGVYKDTVAALNKGIKQAQEKIENGTLILLPNGKFDSRPTDHLPGSDDSPEMPLIKQKQPDKTYAEFRAIFKEAGLEKILESKSGTAEFATVGRNSTHYEIVFSDEEIKFNKIKTSDGKSDLTAENCSLTFKRDEAGNYHPIVSFTLPENLYPEAAARYVKRDAIEKINLLKTSEFGKKIFVARLDIENDSRAEIEETNQANLKTYVSRQLGRQLLAEIAVKTAEYNEREFRRNIGDERLKVTADIIEGSAETRTISRADLLFERAAIARNSVNNTKTAGILKMIAEDERIPVETAEKRENKKEIIKAQALQKPWIEALERAIIAKTEHLKELTAQTNLQLIAEKTETDLIIKQAGIRDTERIKPVLTPEKIWVEQDNAVRRADTETFIKLEEIHQASNLPRPANVYARLRGMEVMAAMNVRRENVDLIERYGKEATEQNIIINIRRERGEIKLENWHLPKNEKLSHESPQPTKEFQKNDSQSETGQMFVSITAPRSLKEKINSDPSAKIDLSWVAHDQRNLNAYLNPISVIKNDEGLQIVRAVAGYIDYKNKKEQLAELAEKTVKTAKILEKSSDLGMADSAARLSEAVGKAVFREEKMRESLRLDESSNTELLKTPDPNLNDAEIKQIGAIAVRTGDVQEVKKYYNLVKTDAEFAEAVGETEESLSVKFLLAEARSVQQSNNAIERITPLSDGSIDVELNPAQLAQAIDSFKTADAFEEFQTTISKKSVIKSLSLEDIYQTEQFLAANNPITDSLNNRVFNIGDDLMKNLQPLTMSQSEQQIFKEMTLSQETQLRFAQISQSEQLFNEMAREAEAATQNQIPFAQTAQNFTVVNLLDEAEAKERHFWQNDRQQREAQIARENAQRRLTMTREEIAEQDARALDEFVKDELAQDQEGLTQVMK